MAALFTQKLPEFHVNLRFIAVFTRAYPEHNVSHLRPPMLVLQHPLTCVQAVASLQGRTMSSGG